MRGDGERDEPVMRTIAFVEAIAGDYGSWLVCGNPPGLREESELEFEVDANWKSKEYMGHVLRWYLFLHMNACLMRIQLGL
jgi:hypothetical protein